MQPSQSTTSTPVTLGAALAALAEVTRERDLLRASHERLRLELELLKRRIFVAKAERVDTAQLELEFAVKLAELNRIADTPKPAPSDSADTPKRNTSRPTGRRDLRTQGRRACQSERLAESRGCLVHRGCRQ